MHVDPDVHCYYHSLSDCMSARDAAQSQRPHLWMSMLSPWGTRRSIELPMWISNMNLTLQTVAHTPLDVHAIALRREPVQEAAAA